MARGTNATLGNGTTTRSNAPVGVHLPTGTQVTGIAGGYIHSLALTSDGRVLAWGAAFPTTAGPGRPVTRGPLLRAPLRTSRSGA
ncbi:hypothetical protein [Streptomyces sp. NPDC001020]